MDGRWLGSLGEPGKLVFPRGRKRLSDIHGHTAGV